MSSEKEIDRDQFLCGPEAQEALRIITRLRNAGFVAYLAGGCVRDALLGKPPKDYDVATNATPDSVRDVFGRSQTLAFGASFGVIGVLRPRARVLDSDEPTTIPTEVATFRSDGVYSDGRRPDSVHFGEAEQDALRRDFTINGLFYDPLGHEIIDFVGGQDDLRRGILRTIGDAATRIEEDKLRMLRAVRFATTLRFDVHPETVEAISRHADDIRVVSGERVGAEMRRVLTSPHASGGLSLLLSFGLHREVLPELADIDWDGYRKITAHIDHPPLSVSLSCMLVSMPEPIESLDAIANRWRLSNEECRQCRSALRGWTTIRDAHQIPWSAVQPMLVDRDADTIVELADAVVSAHGGRRDGIDAAREAMHWPAEKLDPPPLITGDDLREAGIPAGPAYRSILQTIRDAQLNGEILSREAAIDVLSQWV